MSTTTPAPAKPAEKPAEAPLHKAVTSALAKKAEDRTMAERQIVRAHALEKQRGEHMEKIAANRTFLRMMGQTEELTDEQTDWLETFYPEKEKGERRSAEQIEATRKAREAARSKKVTS